MLPLGIYVHIPFCKSKCPYCGFYSIKEEKTFIENYILKICKEIKKWGKILNFEVDTIYFGGGTPSILDAKNIAKIIKEIKKNFKVKFPEITLEINPADYSSLDFEMLKFEGINRISIGAQSLEESELKILGRRHNVKDIINTYNEAKKAQIKNISFDFILGSPIQTIKHVEKIIDFYKENNPTHMSAYILKIEEGTPFSKSNLNFASDDFCSDIYIYLSEKMKKLGYNHYEISNFSLPEKYSNHNLKYWNLDNYLGLGPSAHSLIKNKRFYYEENFDFNIKFEGFGGNEEEYAMLRLRLAEGLTEKGYKEKFGTSIPEKYFKKAKKFQNLGLVNIDKNKINLTEKGFLLSNKIISELIL